MRTVLLLNILGLALLSACATHPANPRCGGRLQPINPPAVGAAVVPNDAAPPPGRQP